MHLLANLIDQYLYFLVHLKGMLTHRFVRKHYGQWAEDVIIDSLTAGKRAGVYVDVGAYHPFHYSNTYLLYHRGWHGINIDPNPSAITLFNWHRKRDINLNLGVSDIPGEKKYYLFNHQAYNSFSSSARDSALKNRHVRQIGERMIPCRPLSDIVTRHLPDAEVDVLNVDVEGMGMAVLKTVDWDRMRPSVICIEDDDFDASEEGYGSEMYAYLAERSYRLHARAGASCIYCSAAALKYEESSQRDKLAGP